MKLTKDQITEIAALMKIGHDFSEEYLVELLSEKFGEKEEEWPKKTEEEAEAKVLLLKHIRKFKISNGDLCYKFEKDFNNLVKFFGDIADLIQAEAGILIPETSSPEDRAERMELLKKCFS